MAKIKLTKSMVDAAEITGNDYELRDTVVPGFLCKAIFTIDALMTCLHRSGYQRYAHSISSQKKFIPHLRTGV
jgi:hypothetical protein